MTRANLIARCNRIGATKIAQLELGEAHILALEVLELLEGEEQPCGWEAPEVLPPDMAPSVIGVPNQWAGSYITPEEARSFARMLLDAADVAEKPTT